MKGKLPKWILITIGLIVISITAGYSSYQVTQWIKIREVSRKVFVLDWQNANGGASLLSMDMEGNHLQYIGDATSTVDWSTDGIYLATGCSDPSKICIYDSRKFGDSAVYPPQNGHLPKAKEVSVPEECKKVSYERGVNSISWSRNGESLIIVCQNRQQSNVCIVNLNSAYQCWGAKNGDDIYSRADWSPVDDSIVIDTGKQMQIVDNEGNIKVIGTGRKMQIVDEQGKIERSLIDGWSPAWSPDGKEIAFFRWDDEKEYPGLATIQPDGKNFRWIYRTPSRGSGGDQEYYKLNFEDTVNGCLGSSKISWSPDKKYLVVEAAFTDTCTFSIFRIELKTGKVESLTSNLSYLYQEPSIQP